MRCDAIHLGPQNGRSGMKVSNVCLDYWFCNAFWSNFGWCSKWRRKILGGAQELSGTPRYKNSLITKLQVPSTQRSALFHPPKTRVCVAERSGGTLAKCFLARKFSIARCAPRVRRVVVLCARKGVLAWSAALRFGGGPLLARVLVHAEVICMIVATVIPVRLGVRQPD